MKCKNCYSSVKSNNKAPYRKSKKSSTLLCIFFMEGDGVMNGAGTGISSLSTPLQFIHLLLPTHTHFPLFLFSQLEGDFGDWICFLPQSKVEIRNTFLLQQWIGPGFGMLQISVCHMC
jgi:hypothetical protein